MKSNTLIQQAKGRRRRAQSSRGQTSKSSVEWRKSKRALPVVGYYRHSQAFTLVELMISIALVLLLILGINSVFKYTTSAVGQGQAINAATRDSRAAQTVLSSDFASMIPNGTSPNAAPCIIIRSSAVAAYRDRADELADKDSNPLTIDITGSGTEGDPTVPGDIISSATCNYRNHRIDVVSFFARNVFPRQTGNPGTYVANMASQEAWLWYGHLWLPTNDNSTAAKQYPVDTTKGPNTFPGAGSNSSTNPNNYYATQFVLGRVAMLLREPVGGFIYDNTPAPNTQSQAFVIQSTTGTYSGTPGDLFPLDANAQSQTLSDSATTPFLEDSRLDLAATSITSFRTKLSNYISNAANGGKTWWDLMMDGNPVPPTNLAFNASCGTRFKCNPFLGKPLTAASLAHASPYFLQGCTQFIVEYAGDFVQQDNDPTHATYGQVLDLVTVGSANADGLDYELVPQNGVARNLWQRKIRWYGMPRNASGGISIPGNSGAAFGSTSPKTLVAGALSDTLTATGSFPPTDSTSLTEVVPLRDVIAASLGARTSLNNLLLARAGQNPWIERDLPTAVADYTAAGAMTGADYAAVWGPDSDAMSIPAPSLIRITITLTDTSGRLPDGLTYQYVFKVPPPP